MSAAGKDCWTCARASVGARSWSDQRAVVQQSPRETAGVLMRSAAAWCYGDLIWRVANGGDGLGDAAVAEGARVGYAQCRIKVEAKLKFGPNEGGSSAFRQRRLSLGIHANHAGGYQLPDASGIRKIRLSGRKICALRNSCY